MPPSNYICTVTEGGISAGRNFVDMILSVKSLAPNALTVLALRGQKTLSSKWTAHLRGPPRPATFPIRSQWPTPFLGTSQLWNQKGMCLDVRQAVFLLYPVLLLKFQILFSVLPDSQRKDKAKAQKQTRHLGDIGFLSQSPAALQSHASKGTFLPAPAHSSLPLLSERYCVSSSYTRSGVDDELPWAAPWSAWVWAQGDPGSSPDPAARHFVQLWKVV